MKLTDLHKNQGLKIEGDTRRGGVSDRYGSGVSHVTDRKEQRKLDAAAGLVPFACDLNETVAQLLKKGLAAKK
jgi:hypothetical protein